MIARCEIKGENLIKGVRLEGIRVIGPASWWASHYAAQGADEVQVQDVVASLYDRPASPEVFERVVERVHIPVVVGGGVRSVDDARALLAAGAERVSINTAALRRPELLAELADAFGQSAVTVAVEARRVVDGWRCFADGGRESTGRDMSEWIAFASRWCGEIVVQSVDQDGTRDGFDLDMLRAAVNASRVSVVASGGLGRASDAVAAALTGVEGVAAAAALHAGEVTIVDIKQALVGAGYHCRQERAA